MLKGKTVILGVAGGIAAYKIAVLARLLVKQNCDVHVIMTQNATNFINPITFETLTNHKCLVDTFDRNFEFHVEHVALAKLADAVLIAPATANIIGKMAHGLADDMLTTTVLACTCPKITAPAMNTRMYQNGIVQNNIKILEQNGFEIVKPSTGLLACGDEGDGKMAEPETLLDYLLRELSPDYVSGLTLLGGEPGEVENQRGLIPFLHRLRQEQPHKSIWCYSGFTWEQLTGKEPSRCRCEVTDEFLSLLDVLVDGPYVEELHDITLLFRGSSNQRLIDVPKTLKTGEVALWQP